MPPTVVVPWRGGCPHRKSAFAWVRRRYGQEHPDWPLIHAEAPDGPWCKADAVMPAIEQSAADVIVVADADVWCEGIDRAAMAVQAGVAQWAVPHHHVHRLTDEGTAALVAGHESEGLPLDDQVREGVLGGGIVVAHRDTFLEVPFDRRFTGWGQEDSVLGYALHVLCGPPWRGEEPLWHLWHPPQERLSRRWGSLEGKRLRSRYVAARRSPDQMRALLKEAR